MLSYRYFLFGYYAGEPVYQHQSGQEYLFRAHGQAWAIGATPGGLRVGIIAFSNSSCPYRVGEEWQHSTRGQLDMDPGLRVECLPNSEVQNPIVRTTTTTTSAAPSTTTASVENLIVNSWLKEQMERVEEEQEQDLLERQKLEEQLLQMNLQQQWDDKTGIGNPAVDQGGLEAAISQGMEGRWEEEEDLLDSLVGGVAAERRATSVIQALEQLDDLHEQLEKPSVQSEVGDVTTTREGILTVNNGEKGVLAAQQLEDGPRPLGHSSQNGFNGQFSGNHVGIPEDQDNGESIQLYFYSTPPLPVSNQLDGQSDKRLRSPRPKNKRKPSQALLPTMLPRRKKATPRHRPPPTRPPQSITTTQKATTSSFNDILQAFQHSKSKNPTKSPNFGSQALHPAYTSSAISTSNQKLEQHIVQQQLNSPNPAPVTNDVCNCSSILITSNNPVTVAKHSTELGQYRLAGELGGRPVYRHVRGGFYLYYQVSEVQQLNVGLSKGPFQEESGGNWLVNTAPGLLFGGIQNSKDFPICPYLLSTVWQYGDSEVGGWVYDPSLQVHICLILTAKIPALLQVTCPSHPCSVVKCGFRATCSVLGGEARCECRPGFQGDPYTRCYPRAQDSCNCRTLTVDSRGPSSIHQRDKMGSFHLWGYYNEHPVYQHYSGLDFLYFHKNQVCNPMCSVSLFLFRICSFHFARFGGLDPKLGGNELVC